jgi:hypothetical protein
MQFRMLKWVFWALCPHVASFYTRVYHRTNLNPFYDQNGGDRSVHSKQRTGNIYEGVVSLDNVHNFRLVLPDYPLPVYRSAALDRMTQRDATKLLSNESIGISTVIDFRNFDEIVQAGETRLINGGQQFYSEFSIAPSLTYPRRLMPQKVRYEAPLFDDLVSRVLANFLPFFFVTTD